MQLDEDCRGDKEAKKMDLDQPLYPEKKGTSCWWECRDRWLEFLVDIHDIDYTIKTCDSGLVNIIISLKKRKKEVHSGDDYLPHLLRPGLTASRLVRLQSVISLVASVPQSHFTSTGQSLYTHRNKRSFSSSIHSTSSACNSSNLGPNMFASFHSRQMPSNLLGPRLVPNFSRMSGSVSSRVVGNPTDPCLKLAAVGFAVITPTARQSRLCRKSSSWIAWAMMGAPEAGKWRSAMYWEVNNSGVRGEARSHSSRSTRCRVWIWTSSWNVSPS